VKFTRPVHLAVAAAATALLAACSPAPQQGVPEPTESNPTPRALSPPLVRPSLGKDFPTIPANPRLDAWNDPVRRGAVVIEEAKPPLPVLVTRRDSSGGLVMSLGRGLYTGKHAQQSIELHLAPILPLSDVPLARRIDIKALDSASASTLRSMALADQLTLRTDNDEVQRMRAVLGTDPLPEFTALLATSVFAQRDVITAATSQVAISSDWRKSALAWIATAIRIDQVERYIAFNMTPYVLSHIGIQDASQAESATFARADAIALARVHHATQQYSDDQLHQLILAISQPEVVLAFGLASRCFYTQSPAFLNHFHGQFVAALAHRQ